MSLKKFLTDVNKRHKDLERKLVLPGIQKTLERASKALQEAWDKYDEAFSDIGTFEDQEAAETERDVLDDKVGNLLSRVEEFLEPGAQRQEMPGSDAENSVVKYRARAAAQNRVLSPK